MKILVRSTASKQWQPVDSLAYTAEHELQRLLAETPSLMTIDELREGVAPLVVGVREVGLPGSGNTDILAFSPAGDIVIVECKLAENAEIKRKVVAQVLEYGSFLWEMQYDDLNERIAARTGKDLAVLVGEAASEEEWDEEQFRAAVQQNLQNGAFILIIAVDSMNPELERTIRFLNNCGRPAFVFTALEMQRYQKGDTEILVPHIFENLPKKQPASTSSRRQWTEDQFFNEVSGKFSVEVVTIMRDLYDWGRVAAGQQPFGNGKTGSFTYHYLVGKKIVSLFSVRTDGTLVLHYALLVKQIPTEDIERFHSELVKISCFQDIPFNFNSWPAISIEAAFAGNSQDLSAFKRVVEAFGRRLRENR